ncbi:MAG: response regulator, partial [Candidatus Omnitrophica bacterium]|nr:response regulator [Candidatus Omnitrophota bacterium]
MFSRNIKILLVDDDTVFRQMLKDMFRRIGNCKVITVKGANMGNWFAQCPWHKPDVILLDVKMPNIDGLELLKILKHDNKTKDIPVIMITAVADEDVKLKARKLGCADYIVKPVTISDLETRINRLIEMEPYKD